MVQVTADGILAPGFRLVGRYRVIRHLAAGGFGITYLAEHEGLAKPYAIKEHFPREFAARDGSSVRPNTADRNIYEWALKRFAEEARKLARFKHPAIVNVADVFEDNGTAYMVMEFESGQTMSQWLEGLGRPPSQDELDLIAGPLLDALEVMHGASFLHRDIAPDNIIVRPDGSPCLIDFGAARQAVGQRTKTLTALVKAGFSPVEQYDSDGVQEQGAWTDIYALAATFYRSVQGSRPPEAPGRLIRDTCVPVAAHGLTGYRPSFLSAIDAGLRVLPQKRPQSVAVWRRMLFGGTSIDTRSPPATSSITLSGPATATLAQSQAAPFPPAASTPRGVPGLPPPEALPPPRLRSSSWAIPVIVIGLGAAIAGGVLWVRQSTVSRQATPATLPSSTATRTPQKSAPAQPLPQKQVAAEPPPAPANRPLTAAEERTLKPKDEFQECNVCPRMVVVPAGRFNMGSTSDERDRGDSEGPLHEVTIRKPFAVGKFEVTFAQWDACVAEGGCQLNKSPSDSGWGRDTRPVINVSWGDAKEYVAWLARKTGKGYRLLSEAEWEYVARAQSQTRFHFGDNDSDLGQYAWFNQNSGLRTQPVGQKLPNAFGLHDVHGNVWEWVEDCWNGSYDGAPLDGAPRTTGDCQSRVPRGGAWVNSPHSLRVASRYPESSTYRFNDVGFRLARPLAP